MPSSRREALPAPRREALPVPLRGPLLWLALVSAVAVALLGIHYADTATAGPVDAGALATLQEWFPASRSAALAVDWFGEPLGALLLSGSLAVGCLLAGRWRLAVLAVLVQAFIGALSGLLKPVFERTIHGGFLSYPSGHTAGATAFALVLGLLLAQLGRAGLRCGLLVVLGVTMLLGAVAASAQILLVAHYPTDTLGGFLTALALVPAAALLLDVGADRIAGRRVPPAL